MKKIVLIILIFAMSFCFVGCFENKTKKLINSISDDLAKAELYLVDMDNSNDYIVSIDNYAGNISNNIWQQIDVLDDQLTYLISYFDIKINSIESLCNIIKEEKLEVKKRQEIVIKDMCNGVILNADNMQKLNAKIKTKIVNSQTIGIVDSVQIRNLYINNMCNYIDNIYNILCDITNVSKDVEVKQSSWHNVDSYKNLKDTEQNDTEQNEVINYPYGYGYNGYYGRGMTNPFYYGGYGGYGMYGGMFPFGRNPYMPNIDTFVVYKNIDTYKSIDIKQTNRDTK